MAKKPNAADRTVDIFTGQTNVEAKEEVLEETAKGSETIEQAAERWRNNAFFTQEVVSKSFGKPETKNQSVYRLTTKDGWTFLEQYRMGKDGMAYHWAGIMFPESDLYEITSVFVRASKEKHGKSG